MKKKWLRHLVVVALIVAPILVFGQDAPQPDDGAPPCGGPFGPVCPIDGGLSFLIAAGIALGGKKAHDLYKQG